MRVYQKSKKASKYGRYNEALSYMEISRLPYLYYGNKEELEEQKIKPVLI